MFKLALASLAHSLECWPVDQRVPGWVSTRGTYPSPPPQFFFSSKKLITSLFFCGFLFVLFFFFFLWPKASRGLIHIYVLVSAKTVCPSNFPFSSSTHVAKRNESCKDPRIRFKFSSQKPVRNRNHGSVPKFSVPWVIWERGVKTSYAQLLHSPL
uniref:Uncharacterized protein n=1 Tax=Molossus molossus TaxID=27622 RepID=A0A7J8E2D5_MOLMO|nr:hypothetical protein HJG59_008993 [Molossus molossus]